MRRGAVLTLALLAACDTAPRLTERPPPGYAGDIYVDPAGCAWARTAADGWAPRVARDRAQLCGIRPSPTAPPGTTAPAPSASPAQTAPPVETGFVVQVGAFTQPSNTEALVAELRADGHPAREVALTGGLTAVVVGPFPSSAEADRARRALLAAGYAGSFVTR